MLDSEHKMTHKYQLETYVSAVPTYCAAIPRPFELKMDTLVSPALGNAHINAGFSTPFLSESQVIGQDG